MNNKIQNTDIDFYNIFNLIGMLQLPIEEKNRYLDSMYVLILREYILTALPLSNNPDELLKLQNKLAQNIDFDEFLQIIEKNNPQFLTKLLEFIRNNKEKIIAYYFTNIIEELKQSIELEKKRKRIIELTKKLEYYTIADSLAKKHKWTDLNKYFNLYPSFNDFQMKR